MNSIGRLFAATDPDFLLLNRSEKTSVVNKVVLYLFRATSSAELTATMKEILGWTGRKSAEFRKALSSAGSIQQNLKLYLYSKLCGEVAHTNDYGVGPDERALANRLMTSDSEDCVTLRRVCFRYKRKGYKPVPLWMFKKALSKAYTDLHVYCAKFAYKKMKFMMQANALEVEDVIQDLMEYGIYAVYRAYPAIENGVLHLQNIAKQAIHNHGINMILAATTQGRNPMIRHKDGTFTNVAVSFSSRVSGQGDWNLVGLGEERPGMMTSCNNLIVGIDGTSADGMRPEDSSPAYDLSFSIAQLEKEIKNKKYLKLFRLMRGDHDQGFSDYLGVDNEDYSDTASRADYLTHCIEYLGISQANGKKFILALRDRLPASYKR